MTTPTLTDLARSSLEGSRRPFLWTPTRALSTDEFWNASGSVARSLATCAPGPVAVRVAEPATFVACAVGVWRAGRALLPLDQSRPAAEVGRALRGAGARTLIADDPDPGLVVTLRALRCEIKPPDTAGASGGDRLSAPDEDALLLHTSGTTGPSKCVAFRHDAMVRNVVALVEAAELRSADHLFSPLSPALATTLATCVLPAIALGAPLSLTGRVRPMAMLDIVREHHVTVMAAVPLVYHLLADLPKVARAPDLRMCITNSAPLPASVAEALEQRIGLLPRSNYCSSEAGGITFNDSDDRECLLTSVGRPLRGVHVRIVGDQGTHVADGVEGRVVVSTLMGARGYLDRPDLEAAVFHDGCIWTGDLGVCGPDGYLRLTGRATSTINVAGHLVNPEEVEEVLARHPSVRDALVIGRPDTDAGQSLVALVVSDGAINAREIKEYLLGELAPHKVPRQVHRVGAIPRTAQGKLRRWDVDA